MTARISRLGVRLALALVFSLVCAPSIAIMRDARAVEGQKPPQFAPDTPQKLEKEMAGRKAFAPVQAHGEEQQSPHSDYHEPKLPSGGDDRAILAITTQPHPESQASRIHAGTAGSGRSILIPILVLLAIPAAAFVAMRILGGPQQPHAGPQEPI